MVESIKHQKVPPRQILKSNYVGQTHIISFHHKDAIGRETQKCLKQSIRKTIDFTRLKGTFEEKIMFSYMVYNEKLKMLLFRKSLKPLILLAYKHIF